MFSIQWFDPFMPKEMQPFKDGEPRGIFYTKEAATKYADEQCEIHGIDLPYEIVPA